MARFPRPHPLVLAPAAALAVALAACVQTRYVALRGPEPESCTDSIAARVARLPAESVSIADRDHALWAQASCKAALDSAVEAQRSAELAAAATPGARAVADTAWPPRPCRDSIAARVARVPRDSVSAADLAHAAEANRLCEAALSAPPPSAANPASMNPAGTVLIAAGIALLVLLLL